VVLFSDRLLAETPFLDRDQGLGAVLGEARAEGGTALHDHLYRSVKRLEVRQGRRVVILLSDGVDSHSALRMQEARWLLRRSRALVYWIRIGGDPGRRAQRSSAWKDAESYQQELDMLATTVLETGGRILELEEIEGADAAFAEILAELREQYVIGYFPSDPGEPGTWHAVRVRVDERGLEVRVQQGYVEN
jgi:Ca-activated chloride channel family protein